MTPDVIVCWPRNCDYPLWRQFIRDNRWRFEQVIVVFTDHPGRDLSGWVRQNFPTVRFLDSPPIPPKGDWRDIAVNAALDISDAEWVWFTEQDFFIHDPRNFWDFVDYVAERWPAIGFREPISNRWHPACLFVRRDAIDQSRRYFGPDPVDHFFAFGAELPKVREFSLDGTAEHLQGLSQNHSLIDAGESVGVFKRSRFREYLRECLAADVPLEYDWAENAKRELRGARGANPTAA
jgi:hypothetical protein